MMSFNHKAKQKHREEQQQANMTMTVNEEESLSNIGKKNVGSHQEFAPDRMFQSSDFDRFMGSDFPGVLSSSVGNSFNSLASEPFLSKDLALPAWDYNAPPFKSDAFSDTFLNSGSWDIRFSPSSNSSVGTSLEQEDLIKTTLPKDIDNDLSSNSLTSGEWPLYGNLESHVDVFPYNNALMRSFGAAGGTTTEHAADIAAAMPAVIGAPSSPPHDTLYEKFLSDIQDIVSSQEGPVPDVVEEETKMPPPSSSRPPPVVVTQQPVVRLPPVSAVVLDAAKREPTQQQAAAATTTTTTPPKTKTRRKKRKRKPYSKPLPDKFVYVEEPTDDDVLLGRGGRSNHHPGNKRYRMEVKNLKLWYRDVEDKTEKTHVSQCLVDYVHSYGGRFLDNKVAADTTKSSAGRWYIVAPIVARKKAGQALRTDDDPEKQKAKRERYLAKKKKIEQEEEGLVQTKAREAK